MQRHSLDGFVVPSPWGLRTIRVAGVRPHVDASETIDYTFVEDPAVHYRVRVAANMLLTHAAGVRRLIAAWTSAGHPNGSDLELSLDAIHSAADDRPMPTDSRALGAIDAPRRAPSA